MKAQTRLVIVSVVLVFCLAGSSFMQDSRIMESLDFRRTQQQDLAASLTPSGPITITSNADFVSQGYLGSGIQGDPYLIQDLEFSTSDISIDIRNTDVYFRITGCSFTGPGQNSGRAISLQYVGNGSVDSCNFQSVQFGISAEYSANMSFVSNDCDYVGYGIWCSYSNNVTMIGNTIIDAKDEGIGTYFCYDCIIHQNSVTNCGEYGLWIYETYDSFLTNNTIVHSGYRAMENEWWPYSFGIRVGNCANNTLIGNIIQDSRDCGMELWGDNHTLIENHISNSGPWGDVLYGGDYGTFIDNTFEQGLLLYSSQASFMTGNTVAGKPLGYFYALDSTSIDVSSYGQVILDTCSNIEIHSGDFQDVIVGIHLQQSTYCIVDDVEIEAAREGIRLSYSHGCTINGTEIFKSTKHGVYNYESNTLSILHSNITESGGSGVRIEYASDCNITSNTFIGNLDGGVCNYDSSRTYMRNNSFFGDGLVVYANEIDTYNITAIDNQVNEKPLGYFFDEIGGGVSDQEFGQIYVAMCDGFVVDNCNVSYASNGVVFGTSTDCTIQNSYLTHNTRRGVWNFFSPGTSILNCVISENEDIGIVISEGEFTVIEGNTVANNGGAGIEIWAGDYLTIEDNHFVGNQGYGLICDWPQTWTLYRNNFSNNGDDGLVLWHGWNLDVQNNTVTNNAGDGFFLDETEFSVFTGNWLMNNSDYGFHLNSQCDSNTLYDNVIGGLSKDDGANTQWDNGVDLGNVWEDYSGEGYYYVIGSGGGVDHYPRVFDFQAPVISSPPDLEVEWGTSGNRITWTVSDRFPSNYTVYHNSTVYESSLEVTQELVIIIDGLDLGVHNFTIIVFDLPGHYAIDTVLIEVIDTLPPVIDGPGEVTYQVDTTGNVIIWTGKDANPFFYGVECDGEIVASGNWNSSSELITINIDGLAIGEYIYTLTLFDSFGRSSNDTVIVSVVEELVIPTTTPSSTTNGTEFPEIISIYTMAITIGSITVLLVVVVLIYRSRTVTSVGYEYV